MFKKFLKTYFLMVSCLTLTGLMATGSHDGDFNTSTSLGGACRTTGRRILSRSMCNLFHVDTVNPVFESVVKTIPAKRTSIHSSTTTHNTQPLSLSNISVHQSSVVPTSAPSRIRGSVTTSNNSSLNNSFVPTTMRTHDSALSRASRSQTSDSGSVVPPMYFDQSHVPSIRRSGVTVNGTISQRMPSYSFSGNVPLPAPSTVSSSRSGTHTRTSTNSSSSSSSRSSKLSRGSNSRISSVSDSSRTSSNGTKRSIKKIIDSDVSLSPSRKTTKTVSLAGGTKLSKAQPTQIGFPLVPTAIQSTQEERHKLVSLRALGLPLAYCKAKNPTSECKYQVGTMRHDCLIISRATAKTILTYLCKAIIKGLPQENVKFMVINVVQQAGVHIVPDVIEKINSAKAIQSQGEICTRFPQFATFFK